MKEFFEAMIFIVGALFIAAMVIAYFVLDDPNGQEAYILVPQTPDKK